MESRPSFETSRQPNANFRPAPSKPTRILVLEDDLCLMTALTRLFQGLIPDVEIIWLASADQAIEEVASRRKSGSHPDDPPYRLVVADVSTPGRKSGLDLWRVCTMRFPDIPFLFISGMPINEFLSFIGERVVCPPFLSKPLRIGECKQVLQGLLQI